MSDASGPGTARVRAATAAGVGRITLARPEKKNALDRQTADELHAALAAFAADAAVRVILLEGEGADFCAGADLEALERMLDAAPAAHEADAEALGRVFRLVRGCPKPVVAGVRGRALAGGAGLANCCDVVIAADDAQFGYPEVRVGFVPAMVMTMLRRSVGEKHAADLVLTGRTVGAAEAVAIGLASRVVPAGRFRDEVELVVAGLAKSPPTALAMTKRLLYDLDALDFAGGIAAGVRTNVEARATSDFQEGVRKFVRRRQEPAS